MAKKTFEKALAELEKIVEKLENPDVALDEALGLFEEGINLSRFCAEKLEEAEKKVTILVKDSKGHLFEKPFEAEEDADEV